MVLNVKKLAYLCFFGVFVNIIGGTYQLYQYNRVEKSSSLLNNLRTFQQDRSEVSKEASKIFAQDPSLSYMAREQAQNQAEFAAGMSLGQSLFTEMVKREQQKTIRIYFGTAVILLLGGIILIKFDNYD